MIGVAHGVEVIGRIVVLACLKLNRKENRSTFWFWLVSRESNVWKAFLSVSVIGRSEWRSELKIYLMLLNYLDNVWYDSEEDEAERRHSEHFKLKNEETTPKANK